MTHVRAHYAEKPGPGDGTSQLIQHPALAAGRACRLRAGRGSRLFRRGTGADAARSRSTRCCFPPAAFGAGATRVDHIWMPITCLLFGRLVSSGWLPDLNRCLQCGASLAGQAAYFHFLSDGLVCVEHRHVGENGSHGVTLTPDSQLLAVRIFRSPASAFAAESWPRARGADLRRFAIQSLERHLERKLPTAAALSRLGGS